MSRSLCPECNASRGIQEFSDGKYCYACHKQFKERSLIEKPKKEQSILELPEKDEEKLMPNDMLMYLYTYHITQEDVDRCNIFWSEEYQRICFPYYITKDCSVCVHKDDWRNSNTDRLCMDCDFNCKTTKMLFCWMRSIDKNKKDKWVFVGEKNREMYYLPYWKTSACLKGMGIVKDKSKPQTLVIVEDQISCVRVSNYLDCVSLGGTNTANKLLLPLILNYDKIVIWLDNDEAGKRATRVFVKKYGIYRSITEIHTPLDPKCYSNKEMEKILNENE